MNCGRTEINMKNKTKQILAFLLVIILFSSVLTACSAENGKSSKANASRTVVDMEGNEVKIPNVVGVNVQSITFLRG